MALQALLLASCLTWSAAELTLSVFGNSAMHGQPDHVQALDSLNFSVPLDSAFSAEVTGQLLAEEGLYAFRCDFDSAQIAMVWVADHLICNTNPPFSAPAWSTDGTQVNPLRAKSGQAWPLVVHLYNAKPNATESLQVSLQWARLPAPVAHDAQVEWTAIPGASLIPKLPKLELQRRELQQRLKQGWNLWSYNLLSAVLLPESCAVTFAICRISTGKCLTNTFIEDNKASIRVGMFATDLSYWQYFVGFQGVNVSLSFSGGAGLSLLAEAISCDGSCEDYSLAVMPSFKWERAGNVCVAVDRSSLSLSALGLDTVTLRTTAPGSSLRLPLSGPHLAVRLTSAFGLQDDVSSRGQAPTVENLKNQLVAAKQAEVARIAAFVGDVEGGDRYSTMEALQAATMWNYIYTPAQYGPILPVSRSWDFVEKPVSNDWSYVIFDWDNIFASYMMSINPSSKDIAYSNLIQVIRSKTAQGFVPNYAAGGRKSADRTEPPIGAKVLLDIYQRCKDLWLVELLFDDLLEWNDWFLTSRLLQPAGLIALGSSNVDGYVDGDSAHTMEGARLESGLDNSPMYDGEFFNASSSMMELYDVGMSSMVTREALSLAELADLLGRTEATRLRARAEKLQSGISATLWNEDEGIFANRFINGSFSPRISPTSFYSMMAGAASDDQAATMMKTWLMNPDHFCISPAGDFAGNKDTCYWGLPSIQASDDAFPALGYWRGYVWGPMAQLTYWSLQEYDHVPAVRQGRQALCKQMQALMLWQWRKNRHICENYSPHRTADDHDGDCSGTKFYHWGALTGMISLLEEGVGSDAALVV